MIKNTTQFSTRSFKQLLKSETDKRISEKSAVALAEETESVAVKITGSAIRIAKEDGRKTVRYEDMRKAILKHSENKTTDSSSKVQD